METPKQCMGEDFTAFVIPKECPTLKLMTHYER